MEDPADRTRRRSSTIHLPAGDVEAWARRLPSSGSDDEDETPPLESGELPGCSYRVVEEIGRGGVGRILKAHDPRVHRDVAIKVLLGSRQADGRRLRRFVEEAQVTGQLEHPNIVPVYELDVTSEGRPYFAMRLVRGRSLEEVLGSVDAGGYPQARRLTDFLKICDAIAYAHARGVIHRDLKPANVMIGEFGEVLVMDWGLAKVLGRPDGPEIAAGAIGTDVGLDARRTREGAILGTPRYMAPEQARGDLEAIDERSDVYALGATLYQMVSLRPPFAGASGDLVLVWAIGGILSPPSAAAPDQKIPRELEAIVLKAMALRPQDRYPRVVDLQGDIEAFLDGRLVSAVRYRLVRRAAKWVGRHRSVSAIGAAAAAALVGLSLVAYDRIRDERDLAFAALARSNDLLARSERHARAHETLERGRRSLDEAELSLYRPGFTRDVLVAMVADSRRSLERAVEVAPELPLGHYLLGRAAALLGEDEEAEWRWRKAIDVAPGFSPAHYELGRLELRRGLLAQLTASAGGGHRARPEGFDRAAARFEISMAEGATGMEELHREVASAWMAAALRRDVDEARDRVRAGRERFSGRPGEEEFHLLEAMLEPDPARAIVAYDRALAIRPGWAFVLVLRAWDRGELGDLSGAIADSDEAIAFDPGFAAAWCNRGWFRERAGDAAGALADAEEAVRLDARFAIAHVNRGNALRTLGRAEEAVAAYEVAIRIDPSSSLPYVNLAAIQAVAGDVPGALAWLDAGIAAAPRQAELYVRRGGLRLQAGDLPGARSDLDRAIELEPRDGKAFLGRARVRRKSADPSGAMEDVLRARDLGSDPHGVHLELAALHYGAGAWAECRDEAGRALALDPSSVGALEYRAAARNALGDHAGAIADCDQALALSPGDVWPRFLRGRSRLALGDARRAIEDFTECVEREPDPAEGWLHRGHARLAAADAAGAEADADAAIERGGRVRGLILRSRARVELGRLDEAVADLETALASMPAGRERSAVEAKLAELRGRR